MEILTSKWFLALLIIILILILLYIFGNKSVHTEIEIQAAPQEVWNVLTNTEKIIEWNTVLVPVEGKLKEGNTVKYEFNDGKSITKMPATVVKMNPAKLLNQKGGMTGILTFNHKYILEEIEVGTRIIIHEEYKGIIVPFWNPDPVEKAYQKLAESLRERVIELKGIKY
jgi:hypothetical protein